MVANSGKFDFWANLRQIGQRLADADGVSKCFDAFCGAGALSVPVDAAQFVLRKVKLQHGTEQEHQ
jgi:hypothetical protein